MPDASMIFEHKFFWGGNINLGNEDIIVVEGIEYMVKMEMKTITR